jgi:hypothetical protein
LRTCARFSRSSAIAKAAKHGKRRF